MGGGAWWKGQEEVFVEMKEIHESQEKTPRNQGAPH